MMVFFFASGIRRIVEQKKGAEAPLDFTL